MARIFLSPLIVDIRAKQKDTVFSKWKGINYIRSRVVPGNPQSALQVAVRTALSNLVQHWQNYDATTKLNRDAYASGKNKSGFNEFIGENVIPWRDRTAYYLTKDLGYQQLTAFSAATGAGSGQVAVTFAPTPVPAGKQLYYIIINSTTGLWFGDGGWAAGTTSPQNISGLGSGTLVTVLGLLRLAVPVVGTDVGLNRYDMSTTAGV